MLLAHSRGINMYIFVLIIGNNMMFIFHRYLRSQHMYMYVIIMGFMFKVHVLCILDQNQITTWKQTLP